MLWYNILNPRDWPGVNIKTGNKRIDAVYYNLLSSNNVSLAASGTMFLVGNSGIRLISSSFVDTSGIRANRILAENYGRINNTGGIIPLYSGSDNGLVVKIDNDNLFSTDIISYDSESNELRFTNSSDGGLLYTEPPYVSDGELIPSTNKISSFPFVSLQPASTDEEGNEIESSSVTFSTIAFANSGLSIGPNNFLDSYKGFILTHDGSGNVAQWKPATYLRENYDTSLSFDGLERIGINWIRYPRRPAIILNKKLYIYKTNRTWSPYPAIGDDINQFKTELGDGTDTICVTASRGEAVVGYTKFAFVDKAGAEQRLERSFNFDVEISSDSIIDPDGNPEEGPVACWVIDIAPEDPGGISDTPPGSNVFIFSVTKGAYFPMQIEPLAIDNIKLRNNDTAVFSGVIKNKDDGTPLENPLAVNLGFKPSTLNNISIRPNIHTAFNMLGEDIDFLIYGKEYTPFNTYDNRFELNSNFIPNGLVPIFKIDSTIPDSIKGSPTGVIYSRFIDREKTQPIGWNFDYSGKVCIKTNDSYILSSVTSGTNTLNSYADVTISGHTYTTSLIAEDIYLKPIPLINNTGKYIRNALLTIDSSGKVISRTPRINPTLPEAPSGVSIDIAGNGDCSLSWVAPEKDGNSKILNYVYQVSTNGGANWIDIPISGNVEIIKGFDNQTSLTISSNPITFINNGIFRVAAQNSIGIGDYSEASETVYINNLSAPKIPINLSYSRNIDSETLSDITLSWNWTQSMGWGSSSGPSGFLIEESSFDGLSFSSFSGIAFINYDGSVTEYSYNETGLSGKDNYLYRLSAVNNSGITSSYNYIYATGLLMLDLDLEEEENKRTEELTNFDFGVIMFTGTCAV
jgi:hypothetical protein